MAARTPDESTLWASTPVGSEPRGAQVCLIETFYGGSHRAWADGFAQASGHDVTLITLPAENWRWRMRGGAIAVARQASELAGAGYRPDVLLVSDLVDLALLRQLLDRVWGAVPTVLYFHENQLTYPSQLGTDPVWQWVNWSSALVADEVWFNSAFHRDEFFAAVASLLDRFPDGPHPSRLETEVRVMPVGVAIEPFRAASDERRGGPPTVLWSHRWEHDKRPDRFIEAVESIAELDFDVVICGEDRLGGDPARDAFEESLGRRLRWSGHADRDRYVELVGDSDIVVSTADHEFFGIAMVEAMAAGCCPVLPHGLSYPELIPPALHAEALYPRGSFTARLAERISEPQAARNLGDRVAPAMAAFSWDVVGPRYDERLAALAGGSSSGSRR